MKNKTMNIWIVQSAHKDEYFLHKNRAVQRLNALLCRDPTAQLVGSVLDVSTTCAVESVNNEKTMDVFIRVWANWEGFLQDKVPGEVIKCSTGFKRPQCSGAWMRVQTQYQEVLEKDAKDEEDEENEVHFAVGVVQETLYVSAQ
jgi:hypothetical protein